MYYKKTTYGLLLLTLILVGCNKHPDTPEEVLESYVTSLAEADCDRAMELSAGEAHEIAQSRKERNCQGWEQNVLSVYCTETENAATCEIRMWKAGFATNRPAGTYNYTYSLEKQDSKWKVTEQWKSLNWSEEFMDSLAQAKTERKP